MTKKDLMKMQTQVEKMREVLDNPNGQDAETDILKSIMILENKIKYYLSSYEVLNLSNNVSLGNEKSQNRSE